MLWLARESFRAIRLMLCLTSEIKASSQNEQIIDHENSDSLYGK